MSAIAAARWRFTTIVGRGGDAHASRPAIAPDVSFQDSSDAAGETTLFRCLGSLRPVMLMAPEPRADASLLPRLYEALGTLGIEAYVVLRAGERSERPGTRCLIDHSGDLGRLYGMRPGCLCLVRPDGHIGLFQRPIRSDRLRDYLASICAADALARAWSDYRLSSRAD